jgi:hypothetical protein
MEKIKPIKEEIFRCPDCNRIFSTVEDFEEHLEKCSLEILDEKVREYFFNNIFHPFSRTVHDGKGNLSIIKPEPWELFETHFIKEDTENWELEWLPSDAKSIDEIQEFTTKEYCTGTNVATYKRK